MKDLTFFKLTRKQMFQLTKDRRFFYALFLVFQLASYSGLGAIFRKLSLSLWRPAWPEVDSVIPFWPFMILPYLLYTPLLILPFFLKLKRQHFNILAGRLFLASAVNYLCSLTTVPYASARAVLPSELDSVFLILTDWIYAIDIDYFLFPSMHVSHTLLISFSLQNISHPLRHIFLAGAIAVCVSTLFTKQHFFLDFTAGIFLAIVIYQVFPGWCCKTLKKS